MRSIKTNSKIPFFVLIISFDLFTANVPEKFAFGSSTIADLTSISVLEDGNQCFDSSFSNGITVFPKISGPWASAIALSSKKLVVAGSVMNNSPAHIAVAQFTLNGNPDLFFNKSGIVSTSVRDAWRESTANGTAIQDDGKIVAAGTFYNGSKKYVYDYDFILTRYLENGTLDPGFGNQGIVTTDFEHNDDELSAVAIQRDQKIVAVGRSSTLDALTVRFAIVRYTPQGILDRTFNGTGKAITSFENSLDADRAMAVAIQDDQKIVVAGYTDIGYSRRFGIVRYTSKGTLDMSFGKRGKVVTSFSDPSQQGGDDLAYSMLVQTDGKIVVVGTTTESNSLKVGLAIVRYLPNGKLDPSFHGTGKVVTYFDSRVVDVSSATLGKNGTIIVAGTTYKNSISELFLSQFSNDGALLKAVEADFDPHSTRGSRANAIATSKDGKILLAGTGYNSTGGFGFGLARLSCF